MNRQEYLDILQRKLRRLPHEDYVNAMNYFAEYFDEAGIENEAQAIIDLGDPEEAGEQIIRDLAVKNMEPEKKPKTIKKSMNGVWIAILAICASPIALPIAIVILTLIFTLGITALSIFFAFFVTAIALIVAAVVLMVSGVLIAIKSFAGMMLCVGAALVCGGLGGAFFIITAKLMVMFFNGLSRLVGRIVGKRGKKNEDF